LHCNSSNSNKFASKFFKLICCLLTRMTDWFTKIFNLNSSNSTNWVCTAILQTQLDLYCNSSNITVCIAILQTQLNLHRNSSNSSDAKFKKNYWLIDKSFALQFLKIN
jgi:hypothetical protein